MTLSIACTPKLESESVRSAHTTARLVARQSVYEPGQAFPLGLYLETDDEWHTYWKNPGDSGMATKIEWTITPTLASPETQWPKPITFKTDGLTTYGYRGPVLLMTPLQVPSSTTAEIQVHAKVRWLECKDVCIPGKGEFSLKIPPANGKPCLTRWDDLFEKWTQHAH